MQPFFKLDIVLYQLLFKNVFYYGCITNPHVKFLLLAKQSGSYTTFSGTQYDKFFIMKKKLVILGAGESGVGAALLGKQQEFDMWVSDATIIKDIFKQELIKNNIQFEEGLHSEAEILNADEVVKS